MRKSLYVVLLMICSIGLVMLTGCGKKYTVTYEANGGKFSDGSIIFTQEYKKGESLVLSEGPSKESFVFAGWMLDGTICKENTKVEKDMHLVAKWVPEVCRVTYKVNGEVYHTQSFSYEESIQFPDVNVSGYTLVRWVKENTEEEIKAGDVVTEDMVLVADLQEVAYKITYRTMAGMFLDGTSEKVIYVKADAPFSYGEIPTAGERLFNGWYNYGNDTYVEEGMKVNQDMVVIAKYRRPGELRELHFVINGGVMDQPENDAYYEGIIKPLPTPTKEGFEFLGWYTDDAFTTDPIRVQNGDIKGDQTYYAKWNLIDKNYVHVILNEIVPDQTYDDLELPMEYQGTKLYWNSSDFSIIDAKGNIYQSHQNKTATLTVEITFQDEIFSLSKEITIEAIHFDDVDNPVAGYFYTINIATKTEAVLENLDIAYYAFVKVDATGRVSVEGVTGFNNFVSDAKGLRKRGIRMVLSVAGGADNFSEACRRVGPSKVADNILDYVKQHNLDGVDIDWEFPSTGEDQINMNLLCQSLRLKLNAMTGENCTPYLLTAAIPSHASYSKFDLKTLNQYLDYVNMMSYDMNAAGKTTHLCPLFKAFNDGNVGYGIDDGIEKFTKAGLDPNKIIIGGAFYGKAYKVIGTAQNPSKYPGLGASAELIHLQYQSGTVTYKWIASNILNDSSYIRYYDTAAQVPYLYSESKAIFITYEDEESLIAKTDYAFQNGMGIMFWEYGYDYDNILTDAICNRMAYLESRG